MLLNLAAPLALADSVKCTVAGVELTGDVDSVPTETKIAGQVSYLNNTLTFHGDVTLTTVGVADLGTIPLIKAISEKNLRLVANGKVTGKAKGNGIEGAEESTGENTISPMPIGVPIRILSRKDFGQRRGNNDHSRDQNRR